MEIEIHSLEFNMSWIGLIGAIQDLTVHVLFACKQGLEESV